MSLFNQCSQETSSNQWHRNTRPLSLTLTISYSIVVKPTVQRIRRDPCPKCRRKTTLIKRLIKMSSLIYRWRRSTHQTMSIRRRGTAPLSTFRAISLECIKAKDIHNLRPKLNIIIIISTMSRKFQRIWRSNTKRICNNSNSTRLWTTTLINRSSHNNIQHNQCNQSCLQLLPKMQGHQLYRLALRKQLKNHVKLLSHSRLKLSLKLKKSQKVSIMLISHHNNISQTQWNNDFKTQIQFISLESQKMQIHLNHQDRSTISTQSKAQKTYYQKQEGKDSALSFRHQASQLAHKTSNNRMISNLKLALIVKLIILNLCARK